MDYYQNLQREGIVKKQLSNGQHTDSYLLEVTYDNFILDLSDEEIFHTKTSKLTQRKLEYLEFVAIGLSNKEIADILFVSVSTVKTSLERLFKILNAINRTDAVSIYQ